MSERATRRTGRAERLALMLLGGAFAAACSAIIGSRDVTLVAGGDAASDGAATTPDGSTAPVATTDGAAAIDAASDGACSADLKTDARNCGRGGHDCLGGDCKLGVCQPFAIALAQDGPWGITVDATHVYWVNYDGDQVVRANKDGTDVTVLAHDPQGEVTFPTGVAVDAQAVYWVNNVSDPLNPGRIAKCALGGCNGHGALLATNLDAPFAIALDDTSVFWVEIQGSDIGRVRKDGGGFGYLATNLTRASGVAADDASVYLGAYDSIARVPKGAAVVDSGSVDAAVAPQTIWSNPPLYAYGLKVDDQNVYWVVNDDPGAVQYAPKSGVPDGGAPTTLAANEHDPAEIALDATNVYWVAYGDDTGPNGSPKFVDGYVMTCPKSGCVGAGPAVIASQLKNSRGIAVDDVAVYWTERGNAPHDGAVMKRAK